MTEQMNNFATTPDPQVWALLDAKLPRIRDLAAHLQAIDSIVAELRPLLRLTAGASGPIALRSDGEAVDSGTYDGQTTLPRQVPRGAPNPGRPIEALSTEDDTRTPKTEIFNWYLNHRDCLKDPQFEVVTLYFRDGLTQEQVGAILGIGRTAVSGRLRRAEQARKQCQAELRRELYQLTRGNVA